MNDYENITTIAGMRLREQQAIKDALEAQNEIARLRSAIRRIVDAHMDGCFLVPAIEDAKRLLPENKLRRV